MGCTSSSPSQKTQRSSRQSKAHSWKNNSVPASVSSTINYDDESQLIDIAPPITLNREDYGEFTFVQCGGAGKVYLSPRKSDGKLFAMKFFGYTSKKPNLSDIDKEIKLMQSLVGIANVVQIEGIFHDSREGYVPNRIYDDAFPVIVMEALLGGDLFERLQSPGDHMTERFLASAFRGVIEALHQIHSRGFVHRDLKLENMIYTSRDPDSSIKVVDFGMMKRVQGPKGIFMSLTVEGTAGYCSPESYLKRRYSSQSDVWQAGCCLYSMLSGNAPFPQDNPERIMAALYAPMVGVGWEGISEPAKDLISRILVQDPSKRFTLEDILNHPWLQPGIAPDLKLDDGYRTRIYKLALRNRLKILFLDEELQNMCKRRRELLIQALPFLQNQSSLGSTSAVQRIISSDESKKSSSSNELETSSSRPLPAPAPALSLRPSPPLPPPPMPPAASDRYIQQKLRYLKSGLFHAPSPLLGHSSSTASTNTRGESIIEAHPVRRTSSYSAPSSAQQKDLISSTDVIRRTSDSTIIRTPQSPSSSWKNINLTQITFQDFVIILNKVDLPQLATLPVFHIFEKEAGSGVMDMKEFLLTILTIYPQKMQSLGHLPSNPNEIPPARLFFNFFDVKETGYIDLEELKLIVGCLLVDEIKSPEGSAPLSITVKHIEDLFHTIDQDGTGKINFEEFNIFFETILRSPTILSTSSQRERET